MLVTASDMVTVKVSVSLLLPVVVVPTASATVKLLTDGANSLRMASNCASVTGVPSLFCVARKPKKSARLVSLTKLVPIKALSCALVGAVLLPV